MPNKDKRVVMTYGVHKGKEGTISRHTPTHYWILIDGSTDEVLAHQNDFTYLPTGGSNVDRISTVRVLIP